MWDDYDGDGPPTPFVLTYMYLGIQPQEENAAIAAQRHKQEAARHKITLRLLAPFEVRPCPPCYVTAVAPGAAAMMVGCPVEVDLREGADGVKALVVAAMGGAFVLRVMGGRGHGDVQSV